MAVKPRVKAPTVGNIADRLRVPVHQIEYLIRARGLTPIAWAGNARIFSEADVLWLESELRRLTTEKEAADASL